MMYKESTEFYQHMNHIEVEKVGFQKLIEMKSVRI